MNNNCKPSDLLCGAPAFASRWRRKKDGEVFTVSFLAGCAYKVKDSYPQFVVCCDSSGKAWVDLINTWHLKMEPVL